MFQCDYYHLRKSALEKEIELMYSKLRNVDTSDGQDNPDSMTVIATVALSRDDEHNMKTNPSAFVLQGIVADIEPKTSCYEVKNLLGWATSTFWITNLNLIAALCKVWKAGAKNNFEFKGMPKFGLLDMDSLGANEVIIYAPQFSHGATNYKQQDVTLQYSDQIFTLCYSPNGMRCGVLQHESAACAADFLRHYRNITSTEVFTQILFCCNNQNDHQPILKLFNLVNFLP